MNVEFWLPVKGYDGWYEVSDHGRVRSLSRMLLRKNGAPHGKKGRILPGHLCDHSYVVVALRKCGKQRAHYVHRLVAEAFIANPEKKPQVNHRNGERAENAISNLEWATGSENILHSYAVLRHPRLTLRGETNGNSRITENDVRAIRLEYQPGSSIRGQRQLATKYGVSQRLILNILHRRAWRHVA